MFWPLQLNSEVLGVPKDSQVPNSGMWVSSSLPLNRVVTMITNILAYTHIIPSQDSLSICSKLLDQRSCKCIYFGVFFLSMANPNCFLGWCQDVVAKWPLSVTLTNDNNILIPTHVATCGVIILLLFNIAHISLHVYWI